MKRFLLVWGAFLSGCAVDCGPQARGGGNVAVGALTTIRYSDTCTEDVVERGIRYQECEDESPQRVVSSSVDSPAFSIEDERSVEADGGVGVVVRGLAEGDGTLQAKVLLITGEERSFSFPLRAREIDELEATSLCERDPAAPRIYATETPMFVRVAVRGEGIELDSLGLPLVFQTSTLDIVTIDGQDTVPLSVGSQEQLTGSEAGVHRLTSPHDAAFEHVLEVVARDDVEITWSNREQAPFSTGRAAFLVPRDALRDGRSLCQAPRATWTATIASGDCEAAVQTQSRVGGDPPGASASAPSGELESFVIFARSPGTCAVDIVDDGGAWPQRMELTTTE